MMPMYFSEAQITRDMPPAITHPEYFYGFIGVTLAWQILFLFLSSDPIRYRMMRLPDVLEKAAYVIAVIVLYFQQRVALLVAGFAGVDLILGALFVAAFWRTRKIPPNQRTGDLLPHVKRQVLNEDL